MTEPWPRWPDPEPTPPRMAPPARSRTARVAVAAGGGVLAAGFLVQTAVEWFLAGYLGPTGTFALRLSVFYGGLGTAYALQGVGILVGSIGWAVREPGERPSRGPGPDLRIARRWRAGRALGIAGGVIAAGSLLFNATALLLTSPLDAPGHFVLLTPAIQIIPSLLLGVGILCFVVGWSLRRTPEPSLPATAS